MKLKVVTVLALMPATMTVAADVTTYAEHVRPIFKDNCFKCHNADKKKADVDLSSYASLMAGGSSGDIVKPGSPDSSLLYLVITHAEDPTMPPKKSPLADEKLDIVKQWIAGGCIERNGGKAAANRPTTSFEVAAGGGNQKPDGPPPMPASLPKIELPAPHAANPVLAMAASPWAPLLAVSGPDCVALFNLESKEKIGDLAFPERTAHVVKFSRNGQLLLAAGGRGAHSGKAVVFDVKTGKRVAEVGADELDSVLAADISSDHQLVAIGGPDRTFKVFSLKNGELLYRIKKHTDWVTALAFSPDGKSLATGDRNGGLHVWDAKTGGLLYTLDEHKIRITGMSWRRDSRMLATVGDDGKLVLWDMVEGWAARTVSPHAGGSGQKVKDRKNKKKAKYKKKIPGVLSVDFDANGNLITTGRDRTARILRGNGQQLAILTDFTDMPTQAVLAMEGRLAVTGDFLGRLQLWERGKNEWSAAGELDGTAAVKKNVSAGSGEKR